MKNVSLLDERQRRELERLLEDFQKRQIIASYQWRQNDVVIRQGNHLHQLPPTSVPAFLRGLLRYYLAAGKDKFEKFRDVL